MRYSLKPFFHTISIVLLALLLAACTTERNYIVEGATISEASRVFKKFVPLFGYDLGYVDRSDDHFYARIDLGPQVKVIPGETRYESESLSTYENNEILDRDEIYTERNKRIMDRPAQEIVSNWHITFQMNTGPEGVMIKAKANDEFDPEYFLHDYFDMLRAKGFIVR